MRVCGTKTVDINPSNPMVLKSQMLCSPIGPSSFWSKSQIGPVERFYQFWGRS